MKTPAVKFVVQCTARKRDRVTGERLRWTHGPYVVRGRAERYARVVRAAHGLRVKVEVVPERGGGSR